jgi:VWFA-related protein
MFRRVLLPFFLGTFFLAFTTGASDIEYDVSISLVNVWVKVTNGKGEPLPGLTSNDFKVLEDGKQVSIECFDEIQYKPSSEDPFAFFQEEQASEKTEEPADSKKFIIFLDLLNTTTAELKFMTKGIQDFLLHNIADNDEVMLAALMPNRKLGVLVPFTDNHQFVADLIAKAPANQSRDNDVIQNERQLMQSIRTWESTNSTGLNVLAQTGSTPVDFYRQVSQTIRLMAADEKAQGMFTLKAIRSFGDYLTQRDLGSHTLIIYIGGGFTIEPGVRYERIAEEAMNKYLVEARAQIPEQITNFHEQDPDLITEIRNTTWYLNRLNLTLYTLDSRGLVSGGQDISQFEMTDIPAGKDFFGVRGHQEALQFLADHTGGLAFTGSQNIGGSFAGILKDLNHQYLICYRAPNHKKKGQYHKIEVTSTKSDVKLRYRKGYYS